MSDHPKLDLAIEQARLAREAGNHPFGAVLADEPGRLGRFIRTPGAEIRRPT